MFVCIAEGKRKACLLFVYFEEHTHKDLHVEAKNKKVTHPSASVTGKTVLW